MAASAQACTGRGEGGGTQAAGVRRSTALFKRARLICFEADVLAGMIMTFASAERDPRRRQRRRRRHFCRLGLASAVLRLWWN